MGDVIDDIGEAVGGAVEAVGNTVTEAVDWAADAAASSAEFVAASAEAAVDIGASVATGDWDGVVDAGENFGGALVDHFEDLGESVVSAAGIAANFAGETFQATVPQGLLEAVDDAGVFDVVDTVSGGLVDVNAEDGKFDFQIGDPDVFGIGVHSSAEGFDSDFNVGVVGGHVASNADGSFDIGADVGVNWGPLPNFGAHVAQDADGQIGVSGRAELYIPTPAGLVGGEVEGAYQETPEGFEVSGSATGRYFSPAGGYVGAGVHGALRRGRRGLPRQRRRARRGRHRRRTRGTRLDRLQRGPRGRRVVPGRQHVGPGAGLRAPGRRQRQLHARRDARRRVRRVRGRRVARRLRPEGKRRRQRAQRSAGNHDELRRGVRRWTRFARRQRPLQVRRFEPRCVRRRRRERHRRRRRHGRSVRARRRRSARRRPVAARRARRATRRRARRRRRHPRHGRRRTRWARRRRWGRRCAGCRERLAR